MELGFTFPLQRHLRRGNLSYGQEPDRQHCWDLHCITLQGQSCLLAVHCASRYTFTLYDVSPLQWQGVEALFLAGLQATCLATGGTVPPADTITSTRTHGRREVAFLNRAWEAVVALDYVVDTANQFQPLLDYAVNTSLCNCAGFPGKGQPLARFLSTQSQG